jgi:hypothetical protein
VAGLTGFLPENRMQRTRGEKWYLPNPTLNPILSGFSPQNGTVGRGGVNKEAQIGRYIPYPGFPLCFLGPGFLYPAKNGGAPHIAAQLGLKFAYG